MRKPILILIFALIPLAGVMTTGTERGLIIPSYAPVMPLERLWRATCIVESSGNPNAYNAKEKATGISQIRPIRLLDYFWQTRKAYTMNDLYKPEISKEIFMYYASKFNPNDLEGIAKAWNGRGKGNVRYWEKIKIHLQ